MRRVPWLGEAGRAAYHEHHVHLSMLLVRASMSLDINPLVCVVAIVPIEYCLVGWNV